MPEERSILAVYAHPDDEAFSVAGVMRRSHDQGIRTALICATRGEEGEISDPSLARPGELGRVREEELREACAIMEIQDLVFLDYHDGRLAEADPDEAVGRIVRQIRRLRPQVVITFDTNGGYGHIDHMAIHQFTVRAVQLAGDPSAYAEQLSEGLEEYAPQKVYANAMSRETMRRSRELWAEEGIDFSPGGNAATIPLEEMGTDEGRITTVIRPSSDEFEHKMRALQAHRTQMNPGSPFNRLRPEAVQDWLGVERFVLLFPTRPADLPPEDGLFDGVEV